MSEESAPDAADGIDKRDGLKATGVVIPSAAIVPTPLELVLGAAWLTLVIGLTWLVVGVVGSLDSQKPFEAWEESSFGAASCLVAGWLVFAMLARYQSSPDSVGPLLSGMLIRLAVVFAGIAGGVLSGLNRTTLFWASFVACYLVSLAFEAVWLAKKPLMAALLGTTVSGTTGSRSAGKTD
jgi:hypothetical protein